MSDPVTFLLTQIGIMNESFRKKQIEHDQTLFSQRIMLEDKQKQLLLAKEEIGKLLEVRHWCKHENEKLKRDLVSIKESFRRFKEESRIEQQKLKAENQKMHEITCRCQEENNQLKQDLESQKEQSGRYKDKSRIEQQKLKAENKKVHDILCRCQLENDQLKLDLESQKEQSGRCKDKNRIEQEKLSAENRKLKTKVNQLEWEFSLANPDGIGSPAELQEKLDLMSKELDQKAVQIQAMKSHNENHMVKLDQNHHELGGARKELAAKADQVKDMVSLYQSLVVALLMTRYEFKSIRKELGKKLDDMESLNQSLMIELHRTDNELKKVQKDLARKADDMQDKDSLNRTIGLELEMTRHKHKGICKELTDVKERLYGKEKESNALKKELEESNEDTQLILSINKALSVKERISTEELQGVRKQLLSGLSDILTHRTNIGIKRMGELDQKPFRDACLQKSFGEDVSVKAAELCSSWEKNIKDPHWQPFKRIKLDGKSSTKEVEAIDDEDKKLIELRNEWGQQVYEAVSVALSELNDYNPSGRYPVPELWNFKEHRKSDLREVIEYLIKQLKSLKSLKRNR